jgi:tetratricopeptide (TPR) repeat protein
MPTDFLSSAGLSSAKEPRLMPQKKLSAALSAISEGLVLAAVALVPLVFLINTSQSLDFPKQIVLLVLVSLSALCWVGAMLVDKTLSIRRTVANPVVLILVAVVFVSALISSARYVGVIGDGGQEYQSFVTTLLFAALYFVVVNIPGHRRFAPRSVFATVIVGGLVSLFVLLQFAGVHLISNATSTTFNLIGSTVVLGIYAAVITVLSATSFLIEDEGKVELTRRIVTGISGALALTVVATIDFWPLWAAIVIGLLAVLIFAIVRPQAIRRLNWLAVPMIALVITVLFLAVNIALPVRAPSEVFPSLSQSFTVARDSLFGHPIFGSGPGTFGQDFAMHRALDLNKSPLWYVQFDRGDSYLTTVAGTLGFAGLVAWLAVIIIGIWKPIAYLVASRRKGEGSWVFALALFAAWLASATGMLLYGASLATLFLFWLLFALLVRATSSENAEVSFESSPRSGLVLTFAFVILIVLSLAGWFVEGTRLYADVNFTSAVGKNTDTQIDAVISNLETASQMNPQSDMIARNLSQAYLLKIQQVINDTKLDANTRSTQVQNLTANAVKAGVLATTLSPDNLQNWAQLGAVYEAIIPYVTGASDQAIAAYTHAAELDPTSPVHPTSLGRVYLAVAVKASSDLANAKDDTTKTDLQKQVDDALANAITWLDKALALKADYAPAIYQKALALDDQDKITDAITALTPVMQAYPDDTGVGLEMAMLYYRNNQKDKAQSELESLVAQNPDLANARWLLATIYEEQSKWDDAIAQVQAILNNEPDNQTVKDRLQTLQDEKSGKTPPSAVGTAGSVAPGVTPPAPGSATSAPTAPTSLP